MNYYFPTPLTALVNVDLNAVTPDGQLLVRVSDFSRYPVQGALVGVLETGQELKGVAHVARVSDSSGLVYLDLDWESLQDAGPKVVQFGSDQAIERRSISSWRPTAELIAS